MSVVLLNVKLQLFKRLLNLQPWLSFTSLLALMEN